MSLREMLSDYWYAFQQELFPRLESELGPMGERYELFVAVLELVRVEALLPYFPRPGRAAGGGPRGAGARLHSQGRVRRSDDARPDRAS